MTVSCASTGQFEAISTISSFVSISTLRFISPPITLFQVNLLVSWPNSTTFP